MTYSDILFGWSMAMSYCKKIHEDGDKIILPQSVLSKVNPANDGTPLFFKIENLSIGTSIHVGVLEFSALEGNCNIPFWIMSQLLVQEGSPIKISVINSLPSAEFIKLKPQTHDILENMSDPRAILEIKLRKYTCLTKGQILCIPYLGENIYFDVVDTLPGNFLSLGESKL
ncbi:MAG TPA: hypothetical protein EYO58_10360, partial [Flavobacteriales bacterium]|nr:hypothetical protein [Flavobacteriales bacterium]